MKIRYEFKIINSDSRAVDKNAKHYPLDYQLERFSDIRIGNSPVDRIWSQVLLPAAVGIPNGMDRMELYGANRAEESEMYKTLDYGVVSPCGTASDVTCIRSASIEEGPTISERSHSTEN